MDSYKFPFKYQMSKKYPQFIRKIKKDIFIKNKNGNNYFFASRIIDINHNKRVQFLLFYSLKHINNTLGYEGVQILLGYYIEAITEQINSYFQNNKSSLYVKGELFRIFIMIIKIVQEFINNISHQKHYQYILIQQIKRNKSGVEFFNDFFGDEQQQEIGFIPSPETVRDEECYSNNIETLTKLSSFSYNLDLL